MIRLHSSSVELHPPGHARLLTVSEMETVLRAPFQHIFRIARPFMAGEIVDLALMKKAAEMLAELFDRMGAVDQPLGARAIEAGIMACHGRGQPGIGVAEIAGEPVEVLGG